jgi:hypothetical protein
MGVRFEVEGHPGFVRDMETGAILNINKTELNKIKRARAARRSKDNEIQDLKNEVGEIKSLLMQLLEKK